MSKTPYEIRAEMLVLAFDILREQEYRKDPHNTQAPGLDDILNTANRLRGFVDGQKPEPTKPQILNETTDTERSAFIDQLNAMSGCCGGRSDCNGGSDTCSCG